MKNLIIKLLAAVFLVGACAASALAAPVSLDITWSGEALGNTDSAFATFVYDADHVFFGQILFSDPAVSLNMNVSSSNGITSYDQNNFQFALIQGIEGLDFSKDLVGQLRPNGCAYGTSTGDCGNGNGGDFNLFSGSSPQGTWYFQLTNANGNAMLVTSMIATSSAVPEPASIALFGLALAGAFAMRRKQAK